MYSQRSAAFDKAMLAGSLLHVAKIEVLVNGAVTTTLPVMDGNVQVDITNAVRRTASITVVDFERKYTPTGASGDVLSVLGTELRLCRGLIVNGAPEYLPQGVFGISDTQTSVDNQGVATITVAASDRSDRVARNVLDDLYVVAPGTNVADAIRAMIASAWSGTTPLVFNFAPTTAVTPALIFQSNDSLWQRASEMAASAAMDLFFDVTGVCTLRPVTDVALSDSVWTYSTGATSILLGVNKAYSNRDVVNRWVVTGESTQVDPPVRGVAQDTDPSSPTNINGPYGKVTRTLNSQYAITDQQCTLQAQAELAKSLGVVEQVQFTAIPHPAHDAGDIITIVEPNSLVNAKYLLESFTMPLTSDATLPATTRKR